MLAVNFCKLTSATDTPQLSAASHNRTLSQKDSVPVPGTMGAIAWSFMEYHINYIHRSCIIPVEMQTIQAIRNPNPRTMFPCASFVLNTWI